MFPILSKDKEILKILKIRNRIGISFTNLEKTAPVDMMLIAQQRDGRVEMVY